MKTALEVLETLFSSGREMEAENWLDREENKGKPISEMYKVVFPDLLTLYETLQTKEKIKGELANLDNPFLADIQMWLDKEQQQLSKVSEAWQEGAADSQSDAAKKIEENYYFKC